MEHEVSLSAGAQLRLTLRRAAPLHATCTESLPLFRASGGDRAYVLLVITKHFTNILNAALYTKA